MAAPQPPKPRANDRVSIRVLFRKPQTVSQKLARPDQCLSSKQKKMINGAPCFVSAGLRSHVMIRLGGATSTAPRIATNFRPVLRHNLKHRSLTTTFAPVCYSISTHSYTPSTGKKFDHVTKERTGRKALYTTMASATSFFDFKPKDSTFTNHTTSSDALQPLTTHREGLSLRPQQAQRQSRPRRKHRLEMRLHTPVRGSGEAIQGGQGQISQRL